MKSIFKKLSKQERTYTNEQVDDIESIQSSMTLYSIDTLTEETTVKLEKTSSRQKLKQMLYRIISIKDNKPEEYKNASSDSILDNINQYEYLGYYC
ncbi:hypothetical protein FOG51_02388 [Hanseniaspora uvarum]|jgi:regulator of replication initiation timing|uniref:Uncharacterized protein n=1 Tax=Hanseniaspora uvarum TaxID=29833 RepID=A0A1E5S0V7_HANUV|nr:hypothetical protein FOG51_02388 [Hanseniaspora uvarum]KAF0275389.1 hypothetical protein FOG50_03753 [Hanseniaspora uvarum]OEJ92635.1 hypothetical protein AWRI3580_g470 [Hanseniaspora uvarum]GMM40330.1 hypothetical protein DAHU10_012310 [Hanseniaspora uvarum]GMM40477.1 hypothetical protein DAHU10_013780 [Hanseniaspora uvarum]